MNNFQQQKNMILPASENDAHIRQIELFSLICSVTVDYASSVCSLREGNFDFYVQSLAHIIQWMFVLYHTHYSRWVFSISVAERVCRWTSYAEFRAGKIVVHKTSDTFWGIAIDRCDEQDNGAVKASNGVVGPGENPAALRGRTVASPEVAR